MSDLQAEPLVPDDATLSRLATIDRAVLGYQRDVDHRWFAGQRRGLVYRRGADVVAYGYGPSAPGWDGPYAALDPCDLPRLLADAEAEAHRAGHAEKSFPMMFFADAELGQFDRYVFFSPSFLA